MRYEVSGWTDKLGRETRHYISKTVSCLRSVGRGHLQDMRRRSPSGALRMNDTSSRQCASQAASFPANENSLLKSVQR